MDFPYNARAWFARSGVLTRLGYAELAVGDAYKALLLVGAMCKEVASDAQRKWPDNEAELITATKDACIRHCNRSDVQDQCLNRVETQHPALANLDQAVLQGLTEALMLCGAVCDAFNAANGAALKYPSSTWFAKNRAYLQRKFDRFRKDLGKLRYQMSPSEFDWRLRSGNVLRRVYPWMEREMYQRDPEVLNVVQEQFASASQNCTVRPSLVRASASDGTSGVASPGGVDVIGVFATSDIAKGDAVLMDDLVLSVANVTGPCNNCSTPLTHIEPTKMACCDEHFCSDKCAQDAYARYHQQLCGKDFSSFQKYAARTDHPIPATETLLFIRMLAAIHQQNSTNPLEANIISRLTMISSGQHPTPFGFQTVIDLLSIAQNFNVNIFTDPNYDTWVLLIILYRIRSNRDWSPLPNGGLVGSVCLLMSFFNHHCGPNVAAKAASHEELDVETHSSVKVMVATRNIKKDEELFISYLPPVMSSSRKNRRHALRVWIGGDCMCSRCVGGMVLM